MRLTLRDKAERVLVLIVLVAGDESTAVAAVLAVATGIVLAVTAAMLSVERTKDG